MSGNTATQLRIPEQDLTHFTHFEPTIEGAEVWVRGLTLANSRQLVHQLRAALAELVRLPLTPAERLGILEQLAAPLQVSLGVLRRRFLNQPIILPARPRQRALWAEELLDAAITNHTIAAVQAEQQRSTFLGGNPLRLMAEAVYRAIDFAGQRLLQGYQLYEPIEQGFWLQLNQLYWLAESHDQHQMLLTHGPESGTIESAYLRCLVLECCLPNKHRQTDLASIFELLGNIAGELRLQPANSGRFWIDLGADLPPAQRRDDDKDGASIRGIEPEPLLHYLQQLRDTRGSESTPKIGSAALDAMLQALSTPAKRGFTRSPSADRLWVSVGLPNTHFYAGEARAFLELAYGGNIPDEAAQSEAYNPFIIEPGDDNTLREPRPQKLDIELSRELTEREKHPCFPVSLVNTSSGGYCIEWTWELPGDVRAGDVIAVREDRNPDWSIAAVRWLSRREDDTALLGIQLLSPRAEAYAAEVHQRTGESEQLNRVLLLPEVPSMGQPDTLITPHTGFREQTKLTLLRDGQASFVQLHERVAATPAYQQFRFRPVKHLEEVVAETSSLGESLYFDSMWSKI